jgi:2-amino-4-hydroxy-6-hydroxymethyldihydropteridine diphosphokinase
VKQKKGVELPSWAVVSRKRVAHIERVTRLIERWADELDLRAREHAAWRDAAAWHDALRDATPARLGRPKVDRTLAPGAWHGPAAAARLHRDGERRVDVLEAIRWHTVGCAEWKATGRALYCADFLEPGRSFLRAKRAALAARFADDPDGVLREVVRMRLERALEKRESIHSRTMALWEIVR